MVYSSVNDNDLMFYILMLFLLDSALAFYDLVIYMNKLLEKLIFLCLVF